MRHGTSPVAGEERASAAGTDPAGADDGPPLRILHVTAPTSVGGLERVVEALASGHVRAGHRVHVAAVLAAEAGSGHPFLRALTAAGVDVHPLVVPVRAYARERARVAELCRRLEPDVVHTHGYRSDIVAAPVAARLGIPVVTTAHGFVREGRKGRLYEWLQRRSFRRFDAVVAVSRPLVAEIAGAGTPRERVHLIPNAWPGGAGELTREAARAHLGVPAEGLRIGWVGRLGREKGPDLLVDALALLADVPVTASFIGDGDERPELEARAAAAGLRGRIHWHGFVDDVVRLFPAFDVFVLSSRTEGTPIVLFEAMAAGVPVVATAVGGVPDVVTPQEAVLVPPGDPRALAEAIRTVLSAPEAAAERAAAAGGRLLERHAPGPWLDRYAALYRELKRRKPATGRR